MRLSDIKKRVNDCGIGMFMDRDELAFFGGLVIGLLLGFMLGVGVGIIQ